MNEAMHAKRSIAFVACCALVACAGSATTQPPAASPTYAEPPAPPSSTTPPAPAGASMAPSTEAMSSAPASAPAQAIAPADASRDQGAAPSASKAGTGDLERAEREISAGDCATACRALGSMERAVAFLCAQAQADGDTYRCSDAKGRLVASRKHVRSSCGSCAGGPSVDPDAPVPSTR
jgi:hypothetical protein